jgi:NADH:ubiquinone oxidoreductase subunit 5 (subunit L)/multisubunit Na+/H+ antiporter MnhA subunit
MRGVVGRGFLWDDLQRNLVVRPLWALGSLLERGFEGPIAVGVTEAGARAAVQLGQSVRRVQSGYLRAYAMVFAVASLVLLVLAGVAAR